ncbi:MAG: hypothetical protein IKE75_04830 [Bacilli bacterium]|nr:hypothetical protein [Bacilli bacterium]
MKKREIVSERLLKELYDDEKYKEYVKYYEEEKQVNLNILSYLLRKHKSLFKIFLILHIILYSSIERLEEEIDKNSKDETNMSLKKAKKDLYIEDIFLLHSHYQRNYERVREALQMMCDYKMVAYKDRRIIRSILSLDTDKELKYVTVYDDEN